MHTSLAFARYVIIVSRNFHEEVHQKFIISSRLGAEAAVHPIIGDQSHATRKHGARGRAQRKIRLPPRRPVVLRQVQTCVFLREKEVQEVYV